MLLKNDVPPTSKEEADARRMRPPPEKYDPDNLSHWSITMTVAWIIWGEIDAVRNEWDVYRNDCADWVFEPDPGVRARVERKAIANLTGQTAPSDPDLQNDPQTGPWSLRQWKPSGWNRLCLAAFSQNKPPQVAIDSLWLAAGEGRIRATALECENAKAFDGDLIEIPAHHWARLNRANEPSGKAMLSGMGRVYREVQFPRLDVKKLWPKSSENAQIAPARKGRVPLYDWEDAMNFAKGEFESRGDFNDPLNAEDGWRSQADLARLVISYMAKHNGGKEPSESEVKKHLKDLLERIRK